ncbi:MAG: hypothetical protein M3R15_28890 [Acidobacteriota bacterium]|nr:hypothetical protein [Acidobacteriota bacterium]
MIKQSGITFFLACVLLTCIWGQTPVSPVKPQQVKADEDDIVRVTTNLVQLDVTVTDKDGQQVTDLKPEDFEIRENRFYAVRL